MTALEGDKTRNLLQRGQSDIAGRLELSLGASHSSYECQVKDIFAIVLWPSKRKEFGKPQVCVQVSVCDLITVSADLEQEAAALTAENCQAGSFCGRYEN